MNKIELDNYVANTNKRPYLLAVLIAFDQLVNALFWGYPDETISSRCHRCNHLRRWRLAERVVDTLFWFDVVNGMRHCELSYYAEIYREHFPEIRRVA